jgi:putative DNA primase/helicase
VGDVVDIKSAANAEVRKYLERVIGQALREGADEAMITTFLVEREKVPAEYAAQVITRVNNRDKFPTLGEGQLKKLGGRDSFRAALGLPPAAKPGTRVELDFPLTERGDAEALAARFAPSVRFDHRRGVFLIADEASGLWIPDRMEHMYNLAVESIRQRQMSAMRLDDLELRKRATEWTLHGENRSRLSNVLSLVQAITPISDAGDEWDTNPWLLGTRNGVVDLRTGEFRKGRPDDRVTMRVNVAFDPTADCPLWRHTLADIFTVAGDPAETERLVEFMQRALGYSITGDCREECCFFTWGEGGNGKGTVMNTVGHLLADYTDDMPYTSLERTLKHGGGIPNDIAKMVNKRFITCAEVNEFTINESRLKALTGRDPITARFLNQEFFTFTPVGKIWIATNNKPRLMGQDDGIWRRIYLIPFANKFDGATKNAKLKDQLRGELAGILNWLIAGTRAWLEHGLNPPATVRAATDQYRAESDGLAEFIEARCVTGAGTKVQAQDLWKAYTEWAAFNVDELFRVTNKRFYLAAKRRFQWADSRNVVTLHGVGLVTAVHGGAPEPRAKDGLEL